jgi:hypothetical protein
MLVVTGKGLSTGKGFSKLALTTIIAAMAVGLMTLPFGRVTIVNGFQKQPTLSQQQTEDILASLLQNVYRSFDHHDESLIYDRLAKSISGELLSDVYLETRESMEVKNQGGLRISVKDVIVTELESVDNDVEEPTFRCRWRVSGWIGHWGHVHRRENEHLANITISVRDDQWKITAMEMVDEQRVEPSPKAVSQRDAAA